MQQLQENKETEIAWFRTPQQGWWYWYNNEIETNAMCLRAIVRLDPKSDVSPRLVKWLLENRRNGYYWRSQRDTAQCIAAMSEYAVAAGEADPDYTLTINLDGKPVKKVRITKENFFEFDNQFIVEGVALEGGEHKVTITKEGKGALYYSAQLRYFTKEENIPASGLQLKVARTYMLLKQIPFEVEVEDAEGNKIIEKRLRYQRIPLQAGDRVESGDVIQVELKLTSDNDYTYLVIEDMKPAGCEPVDLRSGGKGQEGFWANMELRDEKVVFFVRNISRGDHLMRYRLRAEIPGVFHALPTIVQGVYVPDLRGNAAEHILPIVDKIDE
jgi:alpha-2-macroglobulin